MKRNLIATNNLNRQNHSNTLYIMAALFLSGIIIGVTIIKSADSDLKNLIFTFSDNYISTKSQSNFLILLSSLLLGLLLFVLLEYMFGLCAVGVPFSIITLVLFGVFCGLEAACIILHWGLKGILYYIMINLPCNAITAAIMLKCCCESIDMSLSLFNCILKIGTIKNKHTDFKDYSIKFLILILPITISVLISSILFKIFCKLFIFV